MSAESEQVGPAEGFGVVPCRNVWLPVKWAPEGGEGAYHPLQSDDRGAADGVPKTCPTAGEAYRFTWAAYRVANALQQPALALDVEGTAVQPATVRSNGRGGAAGKTKKAS